MDTVDWLANIISKTIRFFLFVFEFDFNENGRDRPMEQKIQFNGVKKFKGKFAT